MDYSWLARPSWHADAACRSVGVDAFYTERGDTAAVVAAKAMCAGCPVRVECLADAQERADLFGIWGGMAPSKRARLRRDARRAVETAASTEAA